MLCDVLECDDAVVLSFDVTSLSVQNLVVTFEHTDCASLVTGILFHRCHCQLSSVGCLQLLIVANMLRHETLLISSILVRSAVLEHDIATDGP